MDCSCSSTNDSFSLCNSPQQLIQLLRHINNELYSEYKNSDDEKLGSTMYIIVMLCLFAIIIVVLMARAIRPTQTIDDQVSEYCIYLKYNYKLTEIFSFHTGNNFAQLDAHSCRCRE
jgi:hypothetical protein